jgi:hypothetical protein
LKAANGNLSDRAVVDTRIALENAQRAALDASMPLEGKRASTGYTDTLGTARAATLMGMASAALWKKAVAQAKKEVAKEAHEKIEHLSKWGTVKPSEAACRDIVQKLLAEKGCYPFPELVAGVLAGIGTKQESAGE